MPIRLYERNLRIEAQIVQEDTNSDEICTYILYGSVDHVTKNIVFENAPESNSGEWTPNRAKELIKPQLDIEYYGYQVVRWPDRDPNWTGMTFTGQNASDLEDIHDNLLQEARIMNAVSRGTHLGDAEIALLAQWEVQIRKIAFNMSNQLPFITQWSMDDYKRQE